MHLFGGHSPYLDLLGNSGNKILHFSLFFTYIGEIVTVNDKVSWP